VLVTRLPDKSQGLWSSSAYSLAISSPHEIDRAADRLRHIRDDYQLGRVSTTGSRQRIAASWDRCRESGVDPNAKSAPMRDDFDEIVAANERLLRACGPIVSTLADALVGTGYVVVVADGQGSVLDIAGDHDACSQAARFDLAPGCDLREAAAGTNAVGTAIADRRALQLLAGEHFCDAAQSLTCTAAPIFAADAREVIGVIDVTGHYSLVRAHLLAIIMQAALDIEELLIADRRFPM
jgi:transcriptional regulator of acetoin/glycerol metabolism